jgi:hypothetical protein
VKCATILIVEDQKKTGYRGEEQSETVMMDYWRSAIYVQLELYQTLAGEKDQEVVGLQRQIQEKDGQYRMEMVSLVSQWLTSFARLLWPYLN